MEGYGRGSGGVRGSQTGGMERARTRIPLAGDCAGGPRQPHGLVSESDRISPKSSPRIENRRTAARCSGGLADVPQTPSRPGSPFRGARATREAGGAHCRTPAGRHRAWSSAPAPPGFRAAPAVGASIGQQVCVAVTHRTGGVHDARAAFLCIPRSGALSPAPARGPNRGDGTGRPGRTVPANRPRPCIKLRRADGTEGGRTSSRV